MRIFCAIRHSQDSIFFYGDLWSKNFYPALEQLGCQMIESTVDLLPASQFMQIAGNFTLLELEVRAQITQKIIDEVRQHHQKEPIDLFLSYFYNAHFDPDGFEIIHRLGIPTVNFYCNSIYQFDLVSEIAAKVNFSWHPEKAARSLYLSIGANPVWIQMGANPAVYYPIEGEPKQARACFVGQRYADRDRFLAALLSQQIPVDIYGSGWGYSFSQQTPADTQTLKPQLQDSQWSEYLGRRFPKPGSLNSYAQVIWNNLRTQGFIRGSHRTCKQIAYRYHSQKLTPLLVSAACGFAESLSQTFAHYEVVLNFSHVWADGYPGALLIPHVRLRDFEAPMCRTCYLTGYSEEIAEFYELGREVDTYCSVDELIDRVQFYLNHPSDAEKLRQAGYQRAIHNHTWKHRFAQLFQAIDLKV